LLDLEARSRGVGLIGGILIIIVVLMLLERL
jgi:hypothetical protein